MSMATATDSTGTTHNIWTQSQMSSCAIACIWMALCRARMQTIAETEWGLMQKMFANVVSPTNPSSSFRSVVGAPQTLDPSRQGSTQATFSSMFANAGTFSAQVVSLLQREGVTATLRTQNSMQASLRRISTAHVTSAPGNSSVCLFGWYAMNAQNQFLTRNNTAIRAGGHFVVAAGRSATQGSIVLLDPYSGKIREVPNNGYLPNGTAIPGVPGFTQRGVLEAEILVS